MNNDEKVIENNVDLEVENFVDPLDTLIKLEFNENDEVNIEEYSEIIDTLERDLSLKSEDTEEIIKEIGGKYVNKDYLAELIKSYENIKNFYKKYDPNKEEIQNLSQVEKNNLFKVGSFLNKNYTKLINNLLFTVALTKKEYIFLDTALTKKMSYNGTEVFNMVELNELYLKPWKEEFKKIKTDEFKINIDINNIVMIYHFLQSYSVKGTGDEYNRFVSLLQKIAETNKVYNAFNIKKDLANSNFLTWNSNITPVEDQLVDSNDTKL
jgi:hypothetical protein